MLYFYKPKYNTVYGPFETEEDRDEKMNEEGGVMVLFDHEPTEEEKTQATIEMSRL